MKKIVIIIITVLTWANVSFAQQELSMSQAINIGMENNYDLKIIKKSEEIAKINNVWGNTGALPSIQFSASASENYNFNDSENYRTQTLQPEVSLGWVIFDGFSAKITKSKLEELEQQSKGNTVILVESTIQDIMLAYYNCLLQSEMVDVYQELTDLSYDRYKRSLNSMEIGSTTTYDNLQYKTSWLEDQSNFLQQKVYYENAIRQLNYLLAEDVEKTWTLTTDLESLMLDYQLEDLKAKLLSNNKTLENQYLAQSLKAKEVELAKSSKYPSLSLSTGINNQDINNYYADNTADYLSNSSNAYIGLSLSFNIFNGGAVKRSIQLAQISQETTKIETAQLEHSLTNQLLQIYSTYSVEKKILELADEKEKTAKLNLDMSSEKLNSGAINSFNYRDVQVSYMNAVLSKYQAIYNLIESNTDLMRISGSIIAEVVE